MIWLWENNVLQGLKNINMIDKIRFSYLLWSGK